MVDPKEPGQVAFEAWQSRWTAHVRRWEHVADLERAAWAAVEQAVTAAAIRSEPAESGWLIELRGNAPSWAVLNPRDYDEHWTTDSTRALRFARQADADAYIDHVGWTEAFASEHIWDRRRKTFDSIPVV